jgi:hypothetical protein
MTGLWGGIPPQAGEVEQHALKPMAPSTRWRRPPKHKLLCSFGASKDALFAFIHGVCGVSPKGMRIDEERQRIIALGRQWHFAIIMCDMSRLSFWNAREIQQTQGEGEKDEEASEP